MKTPMRFWKEDSGQSIPEYGLILALLCIGSMLVMVAFADELGSVFHSLRSTMESEGTAKQVDLT